MRCRRLMYWWLVIVTALVSVAAWGRQPAGSQPEKTIRRLEAQYWRQATSMDVEAAYKMLRDDHPGSQPIVGDEWFRDTLERAYHLAEARSEVVENQAGYIWTLAAFANSFHDGHLRSRPVMRAAFPDWAGLVLEKRAEHWIIAEQNGAYAQQLVNAEMMECDGQKIAELARHALGDFRIDWTSPAQQAIAAPWLLVDEHNPFVKPPQVCTLRQAGKVLRVPLVWKKTKLPLLLARFDAHKPYGAAGFGLEKAGAGYWIALESLDLGAEAVTRQVEATQNKLRAGPFIVLDMRGNSGGSSDYGDRIAQAVLGKAYVKENASAAQDCDDAAYRASPGNLSTVIAYRDQFERERGSGAGAVIEPIIHGIKSALASGQPFFGNVMCKERPHSSVKAPPLFKGRLYILTDHACFSSCLAVTDEWLRLGAIQLGQGTDSNTHYTDVYDTPMPSGQSTFSTMMALSPGTPVRLGPFVPAANHIYSGNIADTPQVKSWVLAAVK